MGGSGSLGFGGSYTGGSYTGILSRDENAACDENWIDFDVLEELLPPIMFGNDMLEELDGPMMKKRSSDDSLDCEVFDVDDELDRDFSEDSDESEDSEDDRSADDWEVADLLDRAEREDRDERDAREDDEGRGFPPSASVSHSSEQVYFSPVSRHAHSPPSRRVNT